MTTPQINSKHTSGFCYSLNETSHKECDKYGGLALIGKFKWIACECPHHNGMQISDAHKLIQEDIDKLWTEGRA